LCGPRLIAELVVQIRELVPEAGHPFVEIRSLSPGVRRALAREPGLGAGPVGPCLGLTAQLLHQPDSLNESLPPCVVHLVIGVDRRRGALVKADGRDVLPLVASHLLPRASHDRAEGGLMHATLQFQRGSLLALLAVLLLALTAALAPGLAELDLSGLAGEGSGASAGGVVADPAPVWVDDPLEPPLTGMERAVVAR
jgi:hypothetical protein